MVKMAFAFVALPVLVGAISSYASHGNAAPPTGCDYIAVDERLARCGGAYQLISQFTAIHASPACAPFYGQDPSGKRYASFDEAFAGNGCDTTCIWHFSTAADGIRCGQPWGYETLRPSKESCPMLYRMPEGYYTSLAEYNAAHPCP